MKTRVSHKYFVNNCGFIYVAYTGTEIDSNSLKQQLAQKLQNQ